MEIMKEIVTTYSLSKTWKQSPEGIHCKSNLKAFLFTWAFLVLLTIDYASVFVLFVFKCREMYAEGRIGERDEGTVKGRGRRGGGGERETEKGREGVTENGVFLFLFF